MCAYVYVCVRVCIFFSAFLSTVLNLFPLAMRVCGSLGPFVYTKPAEDRQREREKRGREGRERARDSDSGRESEREVATGSEKWQPNCSSISFIFFA